MAKPVVSNGSCDMGEGRRPSQGPLSIVLQSSNNESHITAHCSNRTRESEAFSAYSKSFCLHGRKQLFSYQISFPALHIRLIAAFLTPRRRSTSEHNKRRHAEQMINPAGIMFVGWDSDNDDLGFVTTEAVAGGEVLYFTDRYWTGEAFLPFGQLIEWTVPSEGIPAGSFFTLDLTLGTQNAIISEGLDLTGVAAGGVEQISGFGDVGPINETFFVFQGARDGDEVTPTNFVSAISNEADGFFAANLTGTDLTTSTGAILIDGDHDYMRFDGFDAFDGPITKDTAIEVLSNPDNWFTDGAGFNFTTENPLPDGGFSLIDPVRVYDPDDVTTLFFSGTNVAFFDEIGSSDDDVSTDIDISLQPFFATDIIEIDILNDSIRSDGELDFDEVIFTRVTLVRNDERFELVVEEGSKIKESGASGNESGQAVEQGDTFFTTNDEVSSLVQLPARISPTGANFSGKLVFSLNTPFVQGETANIVREQILTDDSGQIVGSENANFFVGLSEERPPICFLRGTRILTDQGYVPIQELQAGDLVMTADKGLQPLVWTGCRSYHAAGNCAPIRIRKGTLGNSRDLFLSQQHKVLLSGWKAEMLFGAPEVLVAARHLLDDQNVRIDNSHDYVWYHHILLAEHEVVWAEGTCVESLNPAVVDEWLPHHDLDWDLLEFTNASTDAVTVRPVLKRYEGRLLA